MKEISLNNIPRYCHWIEKLLCSAAPAFHARTLAKVEQEYNQEKYKAALSRYLAGPAPPLEFIRSFRSGFFPSAETCISIDSSLYTIDTGEEDDLRFDFLERNLRSHMSACETVVELGCGFGANLLRLSSRYPAHRFIGGEYCDNAIALASRLTEGSNVRVAKFNYYDRQMELFEELKGKALVFTVNSIEQLPSAKQPIDTLGKYRDKIHAVFHFEPLYELFDPNTLLGLLCRKHTEVADYNRDLLSALREHGDIHLKIFETNALGLNPLNPLSAVCWTFQDRKDK